MAITKVYGGKRQYKHATEGLFPNPLDKPNFTSDLADLLLAACEVLEPHELVRELPPELQAWWTQHAGDLVEAKATEERRQQALSKLTREDRIALGLPVESD